MALFKMREPRKFNHKYIFVDERKEKLDKIIENAKRDLGMLPPEEKNYSERIRGAFTGENSHVTRRRENGSRISSRTAVAALFVCAILFYFLIKGVWVF
ncbi:MAG: hypothetical protein IKM47_01970 [Bacteroidaceae bacterium]|nr:hypothetical protein [Bacteroidaceae bacterium]MDO5461195.1 hypothetical protein [Bacteroidales bacterium]